MTKLDGQRGGDRVTQQEELYRKSSLSLEDKDKHILAQGFLQRSAENQREWENGFKIRAILFQAQELWIFPVNTNYCEY